jgi:response regulator RpfG family c-di-GMP phosphodiesterase
MDDDQLFADEDDMFAPEDGDGSSSDGGDAPSAYKVLVVDDDEEIHTVTKLILRDFEFYEHPLELIHAHSAEEAQEVLYQHHDIAMILLDVVMESENAGLNLVKWIRDELENLRVRIVLRTGQPGQAPEDSVVKDYDINDYKSKTELTSQKIHTLMYANLRAYRDIVALERSKKGLKQVIQACRGIYTQHELDEFIQGTLKQLANLLPLKDGSFVLSDEAEAFTLRSKGLDVITLDHGNAHASHIDIQELPQHTQELLIESVQKQKNIFRDRQGVIYCSNEKIVTLFLINYPAPLDHVDMELLNVFTGSINSALHSVYLKHLIQDNQQEIIYRLTEAVEKRNKHSSNHIRRVSMYCELLAKYFGLSDEDVQVLKYATPLHDVGKLAIPDEVLNKPGRLTEEEWAIMQTHAEKGEKILSGSDIDLLKIGAELAGSHRERWDGSGYPKGLKDNEIPLFGRITAVADVFDVLLSEKCYKEAWPLEKVTTYLQEQSGKQFQPELIDILLLHIDEFIAIREKYPDPPPSAQAI